MRKDFNNWCEEKRNFYTKCEEYRRQFIFNCTEEKGNLLIYDEKKIAENPVYEIGFNLMRAKYPLNYDHYDKGFVVDADNKIVCVDANPYVWQWDGDDYDNFSKEKFECYY